MKLNKKGFTLVELIVVIVILSILWTIGFFSLRDYTSMARNSNRLSDLKSIDKLLGIYIVQNSRYPEPTGAKNITYSWAIVWKQWTFWINTKEQLNLNPSYYKDPLSKLDYSYSILWDNIEYQIAWVMEKQDFFSDVLVKTAYANWSDATAYTLGTYNGLVSKVSTWWIDYVFVLPSIISNNNNESDILKIIENKNLIYKDFWNLPMWFSGSFKWNDTFDFTPNSFVIFSWKLDELKVPMNQVLLLQNIQRAYSWTILCESDEMVNNIHKSILNEEALADKVKSLACAVVNFNLNYFVECDNIDFMSYYIINVLHC